ncbi:MerR family transcriptional regulator [Streptomyces sp. NPDC005438]|uniref:MerR family transcriptional regulator n=1 Tax=Streptomyces sp. NPDC005438 TaxID=3156880 RepID=UPI0033A5D9FE
MRIGELSRRTRVPTRLLRYYEEQRLLAPAREENGYRHFEDGDVYRVQQIRGLLDSGLTTEIIRRILPYLTEPGEIHPRPERLNPETVALLWDEADRIKQRVDCLNRNREAILGYLAAVQVDRRRTPPPEDGPATG